MAKWHVNMSCGMPGLLAVSILCLQSSSAQTATPSAVPSLTEQMAERAKHVREFQNLIESREPSVRMASLQAAMKDADASVRQMALVEYIKPLQSLTPDITLPANSPVSPDEVPSLGIASIRWDSDKSLSFTGANQIDKAMGCGGAYYNVFGQVAGGRLSINYNRVCFKADIVSTKAPLGSGETGYELSCQVTLTPNAAGDMLEGPLHCPGLTVVMPVHLPIGS